MNTTVAIVILFTALLPYNNEQELLLLLKQGGNVSDKEYRIFNKQIGYKETIGTNQRLDSLKIWNCDILYTEEFYFHKEDSFLVREYYFTSAKLDSLKALNEPCFPDRYYENGVLGKRYFFEHKKGREQLASIIKNMKSRKKIDKIDPIEKIEVCHAGCGMAWSAVPDARKKAEKKYNKARTPDYYLIETLWKNNSKNISFQRPVKTKIKAIVEGHSF